VHCTYELLKSLRTIPFGQHLKEICRTRTHARTHNHFTAFWILSGTTRVSIPEETFTRSHLLWSSVIPLSASSIYYNQWHPPCSIHVPDSLSPQSHSKFSLVYLLAWHPQLQTPYISSPNHCLLFTAYAHTIATCFAVVPRLCHLILVLSQPFTWNSKFRHSFIPYSLDHYVWHCSFILFCSIIFIL